LYFKKIQKPTSECGSVDVSKGMYGSFELMAVPIVLSGIVCFVVYLIGQEGIKVFLKDIFIQVKYTFLIIIGLIVFVLIVAGLIKLTANY